MALALIAKLDRKKGVSRNTSSAEKGIASTSSTPTRYYRGVEFNGCWVAEPNPPDVELNQWLQHFCILNGHAVLGDDTEAPLLQVGKSGPVLLCGGEVRIAEDGRLVRRGKSGRVVEFSSVLLQGSEDAFISEVEEDDDDRTSFVPSKSASSR